MKYLLGPEGRAALARIVGKRPVLAFDFDGTLAPIVSRPDRARISARTRRLLERLTRRYPCAVLSGRTFEDVAGRLRGVPLACLVGNHGAEGFPPRGSNARLRDEVRRWRASLTSDLGGVEGVEIEDKGLSLAVHVRRAPERGRTLRRVRRALARLGGARVYEGLEVFNVVSPHAPDKGRALGRILRLFRARAGLYVGDDTTDEDAFRVPRSPELVTVRIGRSRRSRARFYLRRQGEIDRLLALLLGLRPGEGPS